MPTSMLQRWLVVLVLSFASACALTVVRGSWVAPDRPAALGRTLVVGLSGEATWAHTFEAQLATSLARAGVDAVPLSAVEGDGFRMKSNDESLKNLDELVKREGFDSVLIGHLGGSTIELESVPSVALAPWWGWAWGPWRYGPGAYGYTGDYWSVMPTWRVETRLFDTAGDQRLVWSMVLTTEDEPLSALPDIRDEAMRHLAGAGLLPRPKTSPAGS